MLLFLLAAELAGTPPAPVAMERIVVTAVASRVPQPLEETFATVSVIGRDDLERSLSRDIRDALRYEPDISVEYGAARFGLGNIAIRGLEGNRVQVMQDGIRLPDNYRIGSFSNATRNPYSSALLSQVEVLRGPASALYGSDALGGVVSMTTLDPRDVVRRGRSAGAFVEALYADADGSLTRTAAGAARSETVEVLGAITRTDGRERSNQAQVGGSGAARTLPNPQDGYALSQLFKVVVPAGDGTRWRATYDRYARQVSTDVLSLNPQSVKTVSLGADDRAQRERASLDVETLERFGLERLSWIVYRQRSATAQDTVEVRANTTAQCLSANGNVACRREASFHFDQDETGSTLIASAIAGRHRVVAGAEISRTRTTELRDGRQTNLTTGTVTNVVGTDVFPTRDFPASRLDRVGAFVQDEIGLGAWRLIPGVRYDRFETTPEPDVIFTSANPGRAVVSSTDDAWSPKLGALVPLGHGASLAFQYATGFRAPPYFDLNIGISNLPLGFTVIPNPQLRPETSRGLEAGLRGKAGTIDWSFSAYGTDYHDLIVSRAPLPCPADPRCVPGASITFQSQNVMRARIVGAQARAAATFGDFIARAGVAWTRGDDRTKSVPLNSVDPAKIVAGFTWLPRGRPWDVDVNATAVARKTRIDTSAGTIAATASFATADLTAGWRFGRNVTLRAGAFNVFDRKYSWWSDVRGVLNPGASLDRYTQPGRNYSASLRMEL